MVTNGFFSRDICGPAGQITITCFMSWFYELRVVIYRDCFAAEEEWSALRVVFIYGGHFRYCEEVSVLLHGPPTTVSDST